MLKRKEHSILLYSKEGCCLCDEAREMLQRLATEFPLSVQEIDITSDSTLYERYRWVIPVVKIDGDKVLGGRFQEQDLRSLLCERDEETG